MEFAIVISIIVLGLLIIMAEIFLIPGTSIVGILGMIVIIIGIGFAYSKLGAQKGHYVLLGSMAATGVLLYVGFKAYTSQKFSLKETIDGQVNLSVAGKLNVGDEGITATLLRPTGKVNFKNEMWEAYSVDDIIEPDTMVKIIKIEQNKIFVKPVKS
jgi:membrane-bound ClpP family serine protease